MPAQLLLDGLSFSSPTRPILTDVTLAVGPTDRIGLVGENGSGKTTLLRMAAGQLSPSHGQVIATRSGGGEVRIALLAQEVPFGAKDSVGAAIEASLAPLRRAEAELEEAAAAVAGAGGEERYAAALAQAEQLRVWSIEHEVAELRAGFALADVALERPTSQLSGGQRARLALICTLLSRPDVLLLDEPTNHIDDAGMDLLARLVRRWHGPVVFASHDRAFLDAAATSIADLSDSGVARYTGGYADLRAAKAAARARWEAQYAAEQAELNRLRERVEASRTVGHPGARARTEVRMAKKFYADRNATVVSRRLTAARSALANLEERQVRKPPQLLSFIGFSPALGEASGALVSATRVTLPRRLCPTTIDIRFGDRWLVTGGNGSGKSTLLHILAGHLTPAAGSVTRAPRVRVGPLTQEWPDYDPAITPRAAYAEYLGAAAAEILPITTLGLIHPRDVDRPLGDLSVGVRRRVQLAMLLADPPDVLLLDEPTNHLSLDLVEELEAALPDYPGAVVTASHDRWLRERFEGSTLTLPSSGVHPPVTSGP